MYRIGFDAKRLFNNFTGLGNYSRTLLKNLAEYYPDNAYFLYTPQVQRNSETQFFLNSPLYNVREPHTGQRLLWRSRRILGALRSDRINLYHGLSHEIPLGMPRAGIPGIVTIHDLIFKHYPEQYSLIDRQVYDFKFRYACRHADHIIAISESTKQDIMSFYDIPEDKITVIYQSCHERFNQERSQKTIEAVLHKYDLPADYFLFVGSLIPRKNLLGIVQALERLPADLQLPLVIVGQGGHYKNKVVQYAKARGLSHLLRFIQPDFTDMPALYQQADVFLYPSLYEGFGIPILEALFSETPVITSSVSSLPEAAGDGALLVDPHSPEAIARAMEQLLTDEALRTEKVRRGLAHAQQFLGEPLTHQLMNLYRRFLD
jgi:glycosyltransferase involved in cell wall biosynthesis